MKLYTIFTPSHRVFFENYFLKTIPNEFDIVVSEIPQECSTGYYYDPGWSETCYRKVEYFIKICEENMGDLVVFSDVDIQFFGPIKEVLIEELGDYDIACQNDSNGYYCSGFFIFRANEKMLHMFNQMKINYIGEDQVTLAQNIDLVRHKLLSKRFFTIGNFTNGDVWVEGFDFNLNEYPDILMHHGNWTKGIDNKIKLLDTFRKKMDELKGE